MSVPVTSSDLEKPDARNQFLQADLNNAGWVNHVIAMHRCVARFFCFEWSLCAICDGVCLSINKKFITYEDKRHSWTSDLLN